MEAQALYIPAPRPGERFAGLALDDAGNPSHWLYLLPGDNDGDTWNNQMTWAQCQSGRRCRMTPTILPAGTQCRWQYAIAQADPAVWDELASGLLRDARAEPDHNIRDDILLLCLVACELANDVDPATRPFNLDLDLEAA